MVFKLDKTDERIIQLEKLLIKTNQIKILADDDIIPKRDKLVYVFAPNYVFKHNGLQQFRGGSEIYCGKISDDDIDKDFGDFKIYEYLKDETFAYKNAKLTAEATVMLLLKKINYQLEKAKILVIGYGRCGKALTKYFYDMRADFTVATSKPYEAMLYCDAISYDACDYSLYNVIINTAPIKIIEDYELLYLKDDVIIMDISSKPYGFNFKVTKNLNLDAEIYSALPAKYRVESATQTIYEFIKKTQGEIYE